MTALVDRRFSIAPMMDWHHFNYCSLFSIGYKTTEQLGNKKVATFWRIAAALITIFILVAKSVATKEKFNNFKAVEYSSSSIAVKKEKKGGNCESADVLQLSTPGFMKFQPSVYTD